MEHIPIPTAAEGPLVWSDEWLLGYGPLDHRHEEFVARLDELQRAPDEGSPRFQCNK
jgi:hemerythrin